MRARALVFVVVLISTLPSAVAPARATHCAGNGGGFQPASGKTMIIIGNTTLNAELYARGMVPGGGTQIPPAGVMSYHAIGAPPTAAELHAQAARFPDAVLQVALNMQGESTAANVAAGLYDAQIAAFAVAFQQTKRPVYLRIGYEFDRGSTQRSYQPATFVAAWQRIVDGIRSLEVTNVAYVWHSYGHATWNGAPVTAWWPGDAYVDWVAVSIFGLPGGAGTPLQAVVDVARDEAKPLMIAESTPKGFRTQTANPSSLWSAWYAPMISWITANDVKAWSYINQDWNITPGGDWFLARQTDPTKDWGDSRVQANPGLLTMWKAEVTKPRYLHASPTLLCQELGFEGEETTE